MTTHNPDNKLDQTEESREINKEQIDDFDGEDLDEEEIARAKELAPRVRLAKQRLQVLRERTERQAQELKQIEIRLLRFRRFLAGFKTFEALISDPIGKLFGLEFYLAIRAIEKIRQALTREK